MSCTQVFRATRGKSVYKMIVKYLAAGPPELVEGQAISGPLGRITRRKPMIRWTADDELNELIRRYYTGEAGLWEDIRQRVDEELRRRQVLRGAYHIRLRAGGDGRYDVQIDDASGYANEDAGA
jgi:hypothetical protein